MTIQTGRGDLVKGDQDRFNRGGIDPWRHYKTLLDTAMKVTIWSFGAKNFQIGLPSIFVSQTLFWPVTQHL